MKTIDIALLGTVTGGDNSKLKELEQQRLNCEAYVDAAEGGVGVDYKKKKCTDWFYGNAIPHMPDAPVGYQFRRPRI